MNQSFKQKLAIGLKRAVKAAGKRFIEGQFINQKQFTALCFENSSLVGAYYTSCAMQFQEDFDIFDFI